VIQKFLKTTSLRKLPARLRDRVLMQPATQKLLQRFGNELEDKRWVFVLGCYNSGTTLMAEMLQAHRNLDGFPNEGAFLSDVLPHPERFGWPRMWCECADEMVVPADDVERAARIKRQWSLWLRGNPDVVVEKTISNVQRVDFLQQNFRDARFVHILRNGYAVAEGIRRKANLARWNNPEKLTQYPMEMCARQWVASIRSVESAQANGAPIKTVRYEDLTEDPLAVMADIFRFVDVDPIDDASVWGEMDIHEKRSTIRNMNAASIVRLSADEIAVIKDVAGAELDRYGYRP
jgi:hypothetical protein